MTVTEHKRIGKTPYWHPIFSECECDDCAKLISETELRDLAESYDKFQAVQAERTKRAWMLSLHSLTILGLVAVQFAIVYLIELQLVPWQLPACLVVAISFAIAIECQKLDRLF